MLGPLVLGHPLNLTENSLQCLAVTVDGEFAARILLPGNGIHHLESFWPQVVHGLDAAKRTSNAVGIDSPIAANACFKSWSNLTSWISQLPDGDPLGSPGRALSKLMAHLEVGTVWPSDEVQIQLEQQALAEIAMQVGLPKLPDSPGNHPSLPDFECGALRGAFKVRCYGNNRTQFGLHRNTTQSGCTRGGWHRQCTGRK